MLVEEYKGQKVQDVKKPIQMMMVEKVTCFNFIWIYVVLYTSVYRCVSVGCLYNACFHITLQFSVCTMFICYRVRP